MQIPDKQIYQNLINQLSNKDNLSIANQQAYVMSVQEFFIWISKDHTDLFDLPQKQFINKLNKALLDSFRSLLRKNNASPAIIERKIAHIKYFFKWASENNIYHKDPFVKSEAFGTYLGENVGVVKIQPTNKKEIMVQRLKQISFGLAGLLIVIGVGVLKPWVWWQDIRTQAEDRPTTQSDGQFDRRLIIDQNWSEGQKSNIAQANLGIKATENLREKVVILENIKTQPIVDNSDKEIALNMENIDVALNNNSDKETTYNRENTDITLDENDSKKDVIQKNPITPLPKKSSSENSPQENSAQSGFADLLAENYLQEFANSDGYYPNASQKLPSFWQKLWQKIVGHKRPAELFIVDNAQDQISPEDNIVYDEGFRQQTLDNLFQTSQSIIDNYAKFTSPKTSVRTNLQGWGAMQINRDNYYHLGIVGIKDVDATFPGSKIGLSNDDIGIVTVGLKSGFSKTNYLRKSLNIDQSYQDLQARLPNLTRETVLNFQKEKDSDQGLVVVIVFFDKNANGIWDIDEYLVPWSGVEIEFSR